jgi:hypothetical protein
MKSKVKTKLPTTQIDKFSTEIELPDLKPYIGMLIEILFSRGQLKKKMGLFSIQNGN